MKKIAVAVLLGTFAFVAQGQEVPNRPSPEETKQMMESSIGAMAPMMEKMSAAMIEAQLAVGEKPETARRIAQFKRNLYDELLKQGFTEPQAFAIMQRTSLPSASPSQK